MRILHFPQPGLPAALWHSACSLTMIEVLLFRALKRNYVPRMPPYVGSHLYTPNAIGRLRRHPYISIATGGSGGSLMETMADDDKKRRQDDGNKSGRQDGGPSTAVITKTRPQTKRPNMYRVLLLNDDYTPMEFVVHVLERFFNKDRDAATQIMLHVHHHGIGECGIYTYEVAETKVTQVMDFARKHHHPLQCVMEKK